MQFMNNLTFVFIFFLNVFYVTGMVRAAKATDQTDKM